MKTFPALADGLLEVTNNNKFSILLVTEKTSTLATTELLTDNWGIIMFFANQLSVGKGYEYFPTFLMIRETATENINCGCSYSDKMVA